MEMLPASLWRPFCTAGLFFGLALTAEARIDRVVEKEFKVAGPGSLKVEAEGGAIRVVAGGDSVVRVKAKQRIRADSEAEADELLKKLELTLEQTGNDVRLAARYERRTGGFHFGSWPPVNVDFEVTVPAAFATDLRTSGGTISVGDLAGKARLRTSGGNLNLGKMGDTVEGQTSGGNITLAEARGQTELKTSGGSITVGRVAGPAELSTSGGSIKIESAEARLRAHTSGGSIRAGINGPFKDECSLTTSGGSIRVTVDKTAAFRLDASCSGGGVDAEGLTITLEKGARGKDRLAGAVNGGGPLLKLRTSGGGIAIRTQ